MIAEGKMSKKHTKTYSAKELARMTDQTDWDRVDAMTEVELEDAIARDPDAEIEASVFAGFGHIEELIGLASNGPRTQISIKVEDEVLNFFKEEGPGYQSRIHAVLKAYVMRKKLQGFQR